jgi:hypothetical protein
LTTEEILSSSPTKQKPATTPKLETPTTKQQLPQQPATMAIKQSRQQLQQEQQNVQLLQEIGPPSRGMQEKDECQSTLHRRQW